MSRRCSLQILDNSFGINALVIKLLKKCANKLRCSMHRWCLRDFHCFFNNPPSSPCLRVTLLQILNTSGKTYHSIQTTKFNVQNPKPPFVPNFDRFVQYSSSLIPSHLTPINPCVQWSELDNIRGFKHIEFFLLFYNHTTM